MQFVHLTRETFDQFERSWPESTFWQTSAMAEYKQRQGCTVQYVGLEEDGTLLCASCIIGYKTVSNMMIYYALRGFLIDHTNTDLLLYFIQELKKDLQSQKGIYLRFNPYVPYVERDKNGELVEGGFNNQYIIDALVQAGCVHQGFTRGFDNTTEPRWMVVLDLKDKEASTILKEMDQQTRWSVNRSLKYPIEIKTLKKEEYVLFKELLDETSKRRGFESHSLSFFENMVDLFGEDTIEIVMAGLDIDRLYDSLIKEKEQYINEKIEIDAKLEACPNSKKFVKKLKVALEGIELTEKKLAEANELKETCGSYIYLAGAMFIWKNKEVIYLLSASDDRYKKFMGPYAIQWRQIQKALDLGVTRYNFYGTSGIFDKRADDYGVFEFKRGFNPHVEELIGDFELVLDKKRDRMYRLMKIVQGFIRKS